MESMDTIDIFIGIYGQYRRNGHYGLHGQQCSITLGLRFNLSNTHYENELADQIVFSCLGADRLGIMDSIESMSIFQPQK